MMNHFFLSFFFPLHQTIFSRLFYVQCTKGNLITYFHIPSLKCQTYYIHIHELFYILIPFDRFPPFPFFMAINKDVIYVIQFYCIYFSPTFLEGHISTNRRDRECVCVFMFMYSLHQSSSPALFTFIIQINTGVAL